MATARIEIRSRLHEGIYKSHGGGKVETRETFTFGPRNWLLAARALERIREENVKYFGNIGCGATWAVLVDDEGEVNISADLLDYTAPATAADARRYAEQRVAWQREMDAAYAAETDALLGA